MRNPWNRVNSFVSRGLLPREWEIWTMCYKKSRSSRFLAVLLAAVSASASVAVAVAAPPSSPSSPRAVGERSGWQAGRQAGKHAGRLAGCAPSPSVSHKIINLAMFSRTFECGFRLETRLRARIPGNVRKRVQPYLRRAAVCLHPSDSGTRTRKASLVTWMSGEHRDPMFVAITPAARNASRVVKYTDIDASCTVKNM